MHSPSLAPSRSRRTVRLALRGLAALLVVATLAGLAVWRAPLRVATEIGRLRLNVAGLHGHDMIIDGQHLHYFEGGSGDPVVLVHGLGGSAQMDWGELMPYLIRGGHHVYALDLFGFGESAQPESRSYSVAEQAALVQAFLDAEQLQSVTLGGESMGGWIAATVALAQPQRVARLMLFDSAGLTFKPNFDLGLFTPQTSAEVDALMALLIPQPVVLPDYVKDDLYRRTARNGWVVRRALASMTSGVDLLDGKFSALHMPLLIVWGKQDVLTPIAIGEAMHRMTPQSELAAYDGCGHIAVQTCTAAMAPAILRFLSGSAPPRSGTAG